MNIKKAQPNMDVSQISDKGFSSSTPIKHSAIPKSPPSDADQTKENDLSHERMSSKLHNPKKHTTKHFMSTTISAASKATVPRKKILADRNQASTFSNTHLTQTQYNCTSESDDDEHYKFIDDSSMKPYDPFTNYLSPRPKFLRYNPNRYREIFFRKESLIRESKDEFSGKRSVSFDSQKVDDAEEEESSEFDPHNSFISSEEGALKHDVDKIDKPEDENGEEEEIEEFEEVEERCCSLKGILKFVLLLVVLFLSTLYISCMNSPTPLPSQQAIWGTENGYQKIQNHHAFEGGNMSQGQSGENHVCLFEVNRRENHEEFNKKEMFEDVGRGLVENTNELGEVVELKNGHTEDDVSDYEFGPDDVSDYEFDKTDEVSDQLQVKPTAESDVSDHDELEERNEISDRLKGAEVTEIEVGDHENELEDIGQSSDLLGEERLESVEDDSESFNDYETSNCVDNFDLYADSFPTGPLNEDRCGLNINSEMEERNEISDQLNGAEATEIEVGDENELEDIGQSSDLCEEEEWLESVEDDSESFNDYKMSNCLYDFDLYADSFPTGPLNEDRCGLNIDSEDEQVERRDIKEEPVEGIYSDGSEKEVVGEHKRLDLIGVSLFSTMLASFAFIYCCNSQKRTSVQNSRPMEKPIAEYYMIAEKISPVHPNVEESLIADKITPLISNVEESLIADKITPLISNVVDEPIGKVKSSANSPFSLHSKEEASKEYSSHSHAPSVELLGELVIGEVSSSLRSDRRRSKAHGLPSEAQPSKLELSNMDSPSYGSRLTAEKKILQKEDGKEGEVKKEEAATPVRRSSRIRNRTVTSP